jgi:hypothetical protein
MRHLSQGELAHASTPRGKSFVAFVVLRVDLTDITLLHLKTSVFHGGSETLTAVVMKCTSFRDITPCSPLKVSGRFGGTNRLIFSSTTKVEAICSSKRSVYFKRPTRCYFMFSFVVKYLCSPCSKYFVF